MNPAPDSSADRGFMEQALALGALAEGLTSPNPRVGCVLVREGRVVGRGLHRGPGRPHAEALALADAGEQARGATLYVTLEPCAHRGRTPPCADRLAESGVSRVVASMQDPNPVVDGRGFERLRRAGMRVDVGLLGEEALRLNAGFVKLHRLGLPLVTLKAALSLDGMIAAAGGTARWISGEASRRLAHRLRLRHDAILVGAGTLRRDDPRLDVRLPGTEAPRLRVGLAPTLDLDPAARLFHAVPAGPRPLLYAAAGTTAEREARFGGLAEIVRVAATDQGLDLREVLTDLARRGVQSVLVEGGARTLAGFLAAGLADEAALFVAPRLIGARGGTPLLAGASVARPDEAWMLAPRAQISLGPDLLLLGRLLPPGSRSAAE